MPSGIGELDRVTGGGFVPGSVILLGGDPGIVVQQGDVGGGGLAFGQLVEPLQQERRHRRSCQRRQRRILQRLENGTVDDRGFQRVGFRDRHRHQQAAAAELRLDADRAGDLVRPVEPAVEFREVDVRRVEAEVKNVAAVLEGDGLYGGYNDLFHVPQAVVNRLAHYFETYKLAPGATTGVISGLISAMNGMSSSSDIGPTDFDGRRPATNSCTLS